jgi:hypothetical protein
VKKLLFINSTILTALALLVSNGITGVASGAVVYQDNFDNVSVGLFTFPSPQVGTWVSGNSVVRTGTVVPPSAPNYLRNDRNGDAQPIIAGMKGDLAGSPLLPGTPVHAEAMMYAFDGYPVFGLNVDATNLYPWDAASGDGVVILSGSPGGTTVYAVGPTGGLVATGLSHQINAWEKWEIDYVVGASSFDVTVGGNTVSLGAPYMKNSAATSVGAMFFDAFAGTTKVFIDDLVVEAGIVPEPATLSLLGLSGLVLVGRRARRHS